MDKNIIEGDWKQMKGKVQSKWGKLTNDQLDQVEGNREQLVGLIQKNYGLAADAVKEQLREFEKSFSSKH